MDYKAIEFMHPQNSHLPTADAACVRQYFKRSPNLYSFPQSLSTNPSMSLRDNAPATAHQKSYNHRILYRSLREAEVHGRIEEIRIIARTSLAAGHIDIGMRAALIANDKNMLSEIADTYITHGLLDQGLAIHRRAGTSPKPDALMRCAHSSESEGYFHTACLAYGQYINEYIK